MDTSYSQYGFCLHTSRLDFHLLEASRTCQMNIHPFANTNKVHLNLSGCLFTHEDQNSTIITSKIPNIFIDHIVNGTIAYGRIFQESSFNQTNVNQWNIINIKVCFLYH